MAFTSGLHYIVETVEALGNSVLIRKHEIEKPIDFYDCILPILESGHVKNKSKSIVKTFTDSVLIQPNFAGIGFDVKKFLKDFLIKR